MTEIADIALLTPSYEADLDRCKLLCESLDVMARGSWRHYILVADHDLPLFAPLTSARRQIIPDSQVLPSWLKPIRLPFDKKWRWISIDLTRQIFPLTGWHVQQFRKILAARHIGEEVLVMADSDSVFVKPFSAGNFRIGNQTRLYAVPDGIRTDDANLKHHVTWTRDAQSLLGLPEARFPAVDYINNLVTWRRPLVLDMIAEVEKQAGTDICIAMARKRTFSEYQLYGAYAQQSRDGDGHATSDRPLGHTYWSGEALDEGRFKVFMAELAPDQIAIGIQSFTNTSTAMLRQYLADISAAAD